MKFSATGQLKSGTAGGAQKSSHDLVRSLKLEVSRMREENEELTSEMSLITQKYLTEKERVEELVHELGVKTRNESGQKRTIEKIVERKLRDTQARNVKLIESQKQRIEKQNLYKQCLSKNVQDLQDRLRATREELLYSQKQLFAYQKMYPNEPLVIQKHASSSQGSEKYSNNSKKSNKIMHLDFDDMEKEGEPSKKHQKHDDVKIQGRQHNYLSQSREFFAQKSTKNARPKLLVAKSLAIGDGQQKYDWLYNDEETPRDPTKRGENVQTDQTSARYNGQSSKKLLKNNMESLPQTDRSDKFTAASSNIKSTNIKKMKHNQYNENQPFSDEFGNTIESHRANGDDSLLNLNKQKSGDAYGDSGSVNRPSIVKKSLKGVKNIFKKAADGIRASGQAETIAEFQSNGQNSLKIAQNALEVNHDQVEIELESPYPGQTADMPNGQSNGQNSQYVPQNANKSLINEFADQNPLDDDSN